MLGVPEVAVTCPRFLSQALTGRANPLSGRTVAQLVSLLLHTSDTEIPFMLLF